LRFTFGLLNFCFALTAGEVDLLDPSPAVSAKQKFNNPKVKRKPPSTRQTVKKSPASNFQVNSFSTALGADSLGDFADGVGVGFGNQAQGFGFTLCAVDAGDFFTV
jgi:hypothetical protein